MPGKAPSQCVCVCVCKRKRERESVLCMAGEQAVCGFCWWSDGCGFPLQGKLELRPLKCVRGVCVYVCVIDSYRKRALSHCWIREYVEVLCQNNETGIN